jgi:menaquinone-dependent protoporphyrinogen oxidase
MNVLVSAASKHGATGEIADRIGRVLAERGFDVQVTAPEDVGPIAGSEAMILGSAVYAGHWLKPAKELIDSMTPAFGDMPVWLFSSGPVGDPLKPDEEPVDVADIVKTTNARGHRVFAGKLVRKQLSFPERAIVAAFRVADGDFRDWTAIEAWASEIADALRAGEVA